MVFLFKFNFFIIINFKKNIYFHFPQEIPTGMVWQLAGALVFERKGGRLVCVFFYTFAIQNTDVPKIAIQQLCARITALGAWEQGWVNMVF
jgi:hypothetical protein